MDNRRFRRALPWKRGGGGLLVTLAAGLIAFVSIANVVFYGAPPAALPCRNCSGEARRIHVNGFDLYFRELGSDRARAPIVILHGGPGHSSQSFQRSFDGLADQFRVVYYDQRGSGYSQIKPDSTAYSITRLVEELEAIRRDVLGAERLVLVGHSAGGALAQRYAIAYPEHVERLILVASIRLNNGVAVPALWDRLLPALYLLSGWPPADPLARDQWFAQLSEAGAVSRLYDPAARALVADSGYLSFATWREVSRSLGGADLQERLRQLPVPTLVAYGAADSAATGETTAAALCALLPDCTLARFEQSGHWPFLEEPDHFAQTLRDFLTARLTGDPR